MKRTKSKHDKVITHEQWIEIKVIQGITVTTFYPPNDKFEKQRQEKDPQPDLIYRRMNFVHGVPHEYSWTQPPKDMELYGGHCLMRLLVPDWLDVFQAERARGNTIALPGKNLQPRPEQFGPCPCARCQAAAEEEELED